MREDSVKTCAACGEPNPLLVACSCSISGKTCPYCSEYHSIFTICSADPDYRDTPLVAMKAPNKLEEL